MKFVLLPAKALTNAKTRLGKRLGDSDRQAVALAMYRDVLGAVAAAATLDGALVVTSDPTLAAEATSKGFTVRMEQPPFSLNRAVAIGTSACIGMGAKTVATILTDIPLIEPGDVDQLLALADEERGLTVVPSKEGTGSNALLRTPPDVIPSCFGVCSLQRHLAQAERRGLASRLVHLERIEFDIDTADDLLALARHSGHTRAAELALQLGLGVPVGGRLRDCQEA